MRLGATLVSSVIQLFCFTLFYFPFNFSNGAMCVRWPFRSYRETDLDEMDSSLSLWHRDYSQTGPNRGANVIILFTPGLSFGLKVATHISPLLRYLAEWLKVKHIRSVYQFHSLLWLNFPFFAVAAIEWLPSSPGAPNAAFTLYVQSVHMHIFMPGKANINAIAFSILLISMRINWFRKFSHRFYNILNLKCNCFFFSIFAS